MRAASRIAALVLTCSGVAHAATTEFTFSSPINPLTSDEFGTFSNQNLSFFGFANLGIATASVFWQMPGTARIDGVIAGRVRTDGASVAIAFDQFDLVYIDPETDNVMQADVDGSIFFVGPLSGTASLSNPTLSLSAPTGFAAANSPFSLPDASMIASGTASLSLDAGGPLPDIGFSEDIPAIPFTGPVITGELLDAGGGKSKLAFDILFEPDFGLIQTGIPGLPEIDVTTFRVSARFETAPFELEEAAGPPAQVVPLPASGWLLLAGIGALSRVKRQEPLSRTRQLG